MTADSKGQLQHAIEILRDLVTKRSQNAEDLGMQSLKLATSNRDAINRLTDSVTAAVLEMTTVAGMLDSLARRLDAHVAGLEEHLSQHIKTCPPSKETTNG
jgi:hypothetical protein